MIEFNPQNLANSIQALAKLEIALDENDKFFKAWKAAAISNISEFNPQNLANSIHALAKLEIALNEKDPFFMAWKRETISKITEFNPQDLTKSIYAFSLLDLKNLGLFIVPELVVEIKQMLERDWPLSVKLQHQLYIADFIHNYTHNTHLFSQSKSIGMLRAIKESATYHESKLQQNVAHILRNQVGFSNIETEVWLDTIATYVDIFIPHTLNSDKTIVVQVDGPNHFNSTGQYNKSTLLNNYLLKINDHVVVRIDYKAWDRLRSTEKCYYLRNKISEAQTLAYDNQLLGEDLVVFPPINNNTIRIDTIIKTGQQCEYTERGSIVCYDTHDHLTTTGQCSSAIKTPKDTASLTIVTTSPHLGTTTSSQVSTTDSPSTISELKLPEPVDLQNGYCAEIETMSNFEGEGEGNDWIEILVIFRHGSCKHLTGVYDRQTIGKVKAADGISRIELLQKGVNGLEVHTYGKNGQISATFDAICGPNSIPSANSTTPTLSDSDTVTDYKTANASSTESHINTTMNLASAQPQMEENHSTVAWLAASLMRIGLFISDASLSCYCICKSKFSYRTKTNAGDTELGSYKEQSLASDLLDGPSLVLAGNSSLLLADNQHEEKETMLH